MEKNSTKLEEIKLVGLKVRTNNKNELGSLEGKIFHCVQHYFQQQLFNQIPNRKNPGTTLCVYTEYETDHTGDYTYYIGEAVTSFDGLPKDLETLTIPAQNYTKFTTKPNSMPNVLTDAWTHILKMSPKDLNGHRAYRADFEVYDDRASDHNKIVLDIYVGIKPD